MRVRHGVVSNQASLAIPYARRIADLLDINGQCLVCRFLRYQILHRSRTGRHWLLRGDQGVLPRVLAPDVLALKVYFRQTPLPKCLRHRRNPGRLVLLYLSLYFQIVETQPDLYNDTRRPLRHWQA